MILDLGQLFKPDWSGIPPHMSSRDFLIWRLWHTRHWAKYEGFYFDAAVGTPLVPPPGLTEIQVKMAERISVKRIDAIGLQADRVHVIEVRAAASSSAAGAVLLYKFLLERAAAFNLPMEPWILSDVTDPDAELFFTAFGIRWDVVGPVIEVMPEAAAR